jgi:DNA segregation ATPase FtsK/SpoIIIE, S-DNA-T family
VKAWRSNDGFLGDGSFQAGIRATALRPGKDVGTSIMTGATAERFEIVKWFYSEADDDTRYDAAAEVIARALTYLDRSAPVAEISAPAPVVRDLLADLVTVLGDQRVPAADVPARLRGLAPEHLPYRRITGVKLREILEREHGIKVASTGNRYPIDPQKIRAHIASRAAGGPDDGGSG